MGESYFGTNEIHGKVNISIGDFASPRQQAREWSITVSPEQAQDFALKILTESFKAKQSPMYEVPVHKKKNEIPEPVKGIEAYHCLDCNQLLSKGSIGMHSSDHTLKKVIITYAIESDDVRKTEDKR